MTVKEDETLDGFEFDELLVAALRQKGLMIPVTPEEVEIAEAEIEEQKTPTPEIISILSYLDERIRYHHMRREEQDYEESYAHGKVAHELEAIEEWVQRLAGHRGKTSARRPVADEEGGDR